MKLYCADIRGLDGSDARVPGRSACAGSAWAWSLLCYGARECWGMDALPPVAGDAHEKPYFPEFPRCCFSLSHTSTHVLALLSETPVGADIEALRTPPPLLLRTATEEELATLGFFGLWTLRESVYKLTGQGSLRSMRFGVRDGEVVAPQDGVRCRLYEDVPGCAVAAACREGQLPARVIMVDADEIRS